MLAYVFWHWRRPEVAAAAYEALQLGFHAALAEAPPPGFLRSALLALAGAPWANEGGAAYEDWYLLEGSGALDPLNDAAVSAGRRVPHDAAAGAAHGGTAGLYRLRLGTPPRRPAVAYWFAKPEGMSYAELWRRLGPVAAQPETAVWGRQMVLGPAPELCVQAATEVALPAGLAALRLALRPVGEELVGRPGDG